MCITEYNEAETMKLFRKEGQKEGEKSWQGSGDVQMVVINEDVRMTLYKEFNII